MESEMATMFLEIAAASVLPNAAVALYEWLRGTCGGHHS